MIAPFSCQITLKVIGIYVDVVDEFLRYREERDNQPIYVDPMNLFSSFNNLLLHRNTQSRVCGSYTLMELDEENNQYKVMEGTSPSNS